MPTGKVKWFNKKKNYGFIVKDDDGEDIYFHYRGIRDPMLRNIVSEGQKVSFAILIEEKGERAIEVKLLM